MVSNKNCKFICAVLSLVMLFAVSGCGYFQQKQVATDDQEIRLSPDILDQLGLSERWIIKSLGGSNTTIKNVEKSGNNLLVFNSDSALYCINMVTGGVKWEVRFPQKFGNLAQLSFYKNRVLIALSNNIFEINIDSGSQTNHWELSFTPTTSVARDEECMFVGATDDRFYCLQLPLLTDNWKSLQSQQPKGDIWLDTRKQEGETVGNVYFTCDNGTMYAAKYDERKLIWTLKSTGDIPGSLFDKDQCFMPSTDTALYCVNSQTGGLFWKYLSGGKMYEVPSVTGRYVYQPVLGKSLVCLERYPDGHVPGDGSDRLIPKVVWELNRGTQFLCESNSKVFAVNDAGQMVIMNNATGNKELAVYLPNVDVYYSNTQDDLLILANKSGDIMVLQAAR